MNKTGKSYLASLSDADALAVMKRGVEVYNSPDSPLKAPPEQYSQPSEVQSAYYSFKGVFDAAHPNDSKQTVNQRIAQRAVFNETLGSFVDLVALGARKVPSLPAMFGMDFLDQGTAKQASKMAQILVPLLVLQAMDKDRGTVQCKVRGGVKKGIEIHHAYDDPSNETNWALFDSYVNASFYMTGLVSGRRTYVRGRYLFNKGRKGPWSEMVSIMVP